MRAPLLSVLLLLFSLSTAFSAVIGIDFGARFIKVGLIQPGKGIDLVLNEASKRKSSSAAGFNSAGERVYSDDSFNLLGKLPEKQFIYSKMLLGKNVSHPHVRAFGDLGYPYRFGEDPATGAAIIQFDKDIRYRAEEAVAFVLSYCKQIAEKEAGTAVKDAVITIPAFFKETERMAMHNAASIAGLTVLSLMHENTAFAFKYGFDKESEFSTEKDTNVVFYNLGAASYQVSLVSFSSVMGKKNKTTGSLTVRSVAHDDALGGRLFDQAVLNILADEFTKQYPKVSSIRESPRAMGKLRKESERIKEILSANKEFKVGIEALHEDRDLKLVIKRSVFEERCATLFPRLLPPLEEVLVRANMAKGDVDRIELIGGATRIHRVKEIVKDFFGKPTSASINADEAGALGATLYAAKLSTSFRLRDFHITDSYPYAINVKLGSDAEPSSGGNDNESMDEAGEETDARKKGKDKLLFKAGSKFPHKKLITMSRTQDLQILLSYAEDGTPISAFNISGVSAALARLSNEKRMPIGKPKVSVTFALSPSGLLHVAKSEVAIEMQETYEDVEEVNLTGEELAAALAKEAEEVAANERDAAAADVETAGDEKEDGATSSNPAGTNATRTKTIIVEKERKRVHYSALVVEETVLSPVLPLNNTQIAEAVARNLELLKAENIRTANAAAKNEVEAYIINMRGTIPSDDTYSLVSSEKERVSLISELEQSEDWLYEEGRELDAEAYVAKLKELKALVAPVALRASEMVARPKAVSQALEAINWTFSIVETWAAENPEVTAEERDKVKAMCANFTEWLAAKEALQTKLSPADSPAFLSTEVSAKLQPIELEVRKIIKKPKPKPPKSNKAMNESASRPDASAAALDGESATAPAESKEPEAAGNSQEGLEAEKEEL